MQELLSKQAAMSEITNDSSETGAALKKGANGSAETDRETVSRGLQTNRSRTFVGASEWTRENITLSPPMSALHMTKTPAEGGVNTRAAQNEIEKPNHIGVSKHELQDQADLASEHVESISRIEFRDSVSLEELCKDLKPSFVAQSSICWYVLGGGLSCYLLDLLLRRLRRSRNAIKLLDARMDAEGNIIELILCNNHKRFLHWLPGQFVYLNCPQIATYEWHPFTISSMDNDRGQFTLHIKTGGDWTRKLCHALELRQTCQKFQRPLCDSCAQHKENPMSLFYRRQAGQAFQSHCCTSAGLTTVAGFGPIFGLPRKSPLTGQRASGPECSKIVNVVASFADLDDKTGQLRVECKRMVRLEHQDNGQTAQGGQRQESMAYANDCMKIDLNSVQSGQQLYTILPLERVANTARSMSITASGIAPLDLFIDGPFHSPFERLLAQQVSVCIASGVGWTAFSSIFHQITNSMIESDASNSSWWWRWRNFRPIKHNLTVGPVQPSTVGASSCQTRLHVVVIVTTLEQFKPFYNIVKRYFESSRLLVSNGRAQAIFKDPVQEVTAFITRSIKCDPDIVDFCHQEKLSLPDEQRCDSKLAQSSDTLRINEAFVVRFGRPDFDSYLSSFSQLYAGKRKISVYCCGPNQVKRSVRETCKNLNKSRKLGSLLPNFQYHEENF